MSACVCVIPAVPRHAADVCELSAARLLIGFPSVIPVHLDTVDYSITVMRARLAHARQAKLAAEAREKILTAPADYAEVAQVQAFLDEKLTEEAASLLVYHQAILDKVKERGSELAVREARVKVVEAHIEVARAGIALGEAGLRFHKNKLDEVMKTHSAGSERVELAQKDLNLSERFTQLSRDAVRVREWQLERAQAAAREERELWEQHGHYSI